MKCNFCREEIAEGAKVCPLCGSPTDHEDMQPEEDMPEQDPQFSGQTPINGTLYLVLSVLAALLCCLPFGIIGIVFSSRINSQQKNGDYEGARTSARMAKVFLALSLVLALVIGIAVSCAADGFLTFDGEKGWSASDILEDSEELQTAPEDGEDGVDGDLDGLVGGVKPAKQESELGDNWDSYTVQINERVVTLPCEYKDLEVAGLTVDESLGMDNDGMVPGGGYLIGYLVDAGGNSLTVEFINPDDKAKKVQECLVGGITVGEYDLKEEGLKVTFPGGIRIGDTKEEIAGKYGEPEETYEGDNLHIFTWNDAEMYFSTVEADFDSKTGKLVQMSIKNYGNENMDEN